MPAAHRVSASKGPKPRRRLSPARAVRLPPRAAPPPSGKSVSRRCRARGVRALPAPLSQRCPLRPQVPLGPCRPCPRWRPCWVEPLSWRWRPRCGAAGGTRRVSGGTGRVSGGTGRGSRWGGGGSGSGEKPGGTGGRWQPWSEGTGRAGRRSPRLHPRPPHSHRFPISVTPSPPSPPLSPHHPHSRLLLLAQPRSVPGREAGWEGYSLRWKYLHAGVFFYDTLIRKYVDAHL